MAIEDNKIQSDEQGGGLGGIKEESKKAVWKTGQDGTFAAVVVMESRKR